MAYLNRIEIIGNLTRDPETRMTQGNQPVTTFSVATNRRYQDKATGQWTDSPPEYHDVVVWGPLGERVQQVLTKGDRVFISGRTQTRSWEAPDGQKKYKTEIVCDTVLGPDKVSKVTRTEDGPVDRYVAPSKKKDAPVADAGEINIEDIPF